MELALAAVKANPGTIDLVDSLVKLEPTNGMRVSLGFSLYMGSLYVAVEAWERLKFVDSEIDQLLSDQKSVAQLQECRDKVFHPGDANDPILAFHPDHSISTDWAAKLHLAFVRYSKAHFSGFGLADREEVARFLKAEEERRKLAKE